MAKYIYLEFYTHNEDLRADMVEMDEGSTVQDYRNFITNIGGEVISVYEINPNPGNTVTTLLNLINDIPGGVYQG